MKDTLIVECMLQALDDYTRASLREHDARERFGGTSWEYHGAYYIEDRVRAAEEFQRRLDNYIDEELGAC